jgi:ubiquinone/menaquinone biosynthesis C-methylase UbiE
VDETANRQFIELEATHFWFVGRRAIFSSLLAHELDGANDLRVLDVGCGAGGMLGLLQRFGEVWGVDSSPALLEQCRRRGFQTVRLGNAERLPVRDGTVDLLTLFDTLEHIEDDTGVLRECHRALAPGGLLFISTPAYQFLYSNNDRVAHHVRRYTAHELRGKLIDAELPPRRITYFNTLLFPVILPAVLLAKASERARDPGERTNLSWRLPPKVNDALAATMSAERRLLARWNLPFGHSLIAIARRGP